MIGEQVRQARTRKGLSQEDAAKLVGVPRKQFSKLENDKLVTIETFRRIVTGLEMSVVHLGAVDVIPGPIDTPRLLQTCETAIQALQELVAVLRAAGEPAAPRPDAEAILARAKSPRPRITAAHPTIRKLDQVLKARQNGPNEK